MSFSFETEAVIGQDNVGDVIDAAVKAQIENAKVHNYEPNVEKAAELGVIEEAKAYAALTAPLIAREGDTVHISISGHANPSREPLPGWASNMVTISLNQRYRAE